MLLRFSRSSDHILAYARTATSNRASVENSDRPRSITARSICALHIIIRLTD